MKASGDCFVMQGPSKSSPSPNAYFKTGALQQSENYVWNTADALGRGATAVVYFGRNKTHGDLCAVKVFHERESRHLFQTRQREIETLRSLKHRNIVLLLALEQELVSGNEVLVMEYCSGGSVFTMLEQPQYAFGFQEIEFLLFLGDMSSGMQYLRAKGFIHRDIKPGNIMRCVGDDGRSIFKITDFGASRELQDDETFMSIYGTEEYLFPQMYQRAVLREPHAGNQTFDASVDIWSIGVTIYHVCCGQLPFQPYGGRNNTTTMHMITSRKPSGVISGVQLVPEGQIIWSSALPPSCLLSEQLQQLLVTMLSGLLENDPRRMWPFDKYFQAASSITSMIPLNIFNCLSGTSMIVYLNKTDKCAAIQEQVAKLTDIHAGDQLILWTDRELWEVVDCSIEIQYYPKPILHDQLYLLHKTNMDQCRLKAYEIPPFPVIEPYLDVERDAQLSKKANAVAHYVHSVVEIIQGQQKQMGNAESQYRRYIKSIVGQSERLVPEMKRTLEETQRRLTSFHGAYNTMVSLFQVVTELVDKDIAQHLQKSLERLQEALKSEALFVFYTKINSRLHEIEVYVQVLSQKIREQESNGILQCVGCQEEDHCVSKAENLKQKIVGVGTIMMKHRKYRDLHSHEEFIHKCEKQKLQEYCVGLLSVVQEHCTKNLQKCFNATVKQLSILTKHLARTAKVEQNITSVQECQLQLSKRLDEEEERCHSLSEKINKLLKNQLVEGKGRSVSAESVKLPGDGAEGLKVEESLTRSAAKRARTEELGKLLSNELTSLQNENETLKQLLCENSQMMKRFLVETSNLQITGSLDSDAREAKPD